MARLSNIAREKIMIQKRKMFESINAVKRRLDNDDVDLGEEQLLLREKTLYIAEVRLLTAILEKDKSKFVENLVKMRDALEDLIGWCGIIFQLITEEQKLFVERDVNNRIQKYESYEALFAE